MATVSECQPASVFSDFKSDQQMDRQVPELFLLPPCLTCSRVLSVAQSDEYKFSFPHLKRKRLERLWMVPNALTIEAELIASVLEILGQCLH
jgi:hypothetical protein